MVGQGLKKLALENGMRISNGVAYGALRGFAATCSEGAGFKRIVFSTKFRDPADRDALVAAASKTDVTKAYRVQSLEVAPDAIQIIFQDNPGTMKKIREFLDWFIPLLEAHGASGADICPVCGGEIQNGNWVLLDDIAHHYHPACKEKVARDIAQSNQQKAENDTGSYLSGTLGAFLGAVLGAAVWALVLNLGYLAALVGLLIGWLADKGYDLLRGKQGKGKVAILIVAVVLGVVLGTFAADAIALGRMILNNELFGFTLTDIPKLIIRLLLTDGEYVRATLGNMGLGLLFAGLGVFGLLRKTGKSVSNSKMKVLP